MVLFPPPASVIPSALAPARSGRLWAGALKSYSGIPIAPPCDLWRHPSMFNGFMVFVSRLTSIDITIPHTRSVFWCVNLPVSC